MDTNVTQASKENSAKICTELLEVECGSYQENTPESQRQGMYCTYLQARFKDSF